MLSNLNGKVQENYWILTYMWPLFAQRTFLCKGWDVTAQSMNIETRFEPSNQGQQTGNLSSYTNTTRLCTPNREIKQRKRNMPNLTKRVLVKTIVGAIQLQEMNESERKQHKLTHNKLLKPQFDCLYFMIKYYCRFIAGLLLSWNKLTIKVLCSILHVGLTFLTPIYMFLF